MVLQGLIHSELVAQRLELCHKGTAAYEVRPVAVDKLTAGFGHAPGSFILRINRLVQGGGIEATVGLRGTMCEDAAIPITTYTALTRFVFEAATVVFLSV